MAQGHILCNKSTSDRSNNQTNRPNYHSLITFVLNKKLLKNVSDINEL